MGVWEPRPHETRTITPLAGAGAGMQTGDGERAAALETKIQTLQGARLGPDTRTPPPCVVCSGPTPGPISGRLQQVRGRQQVVTL